MKRSLSSMRAAANAVMMLAFLLLPIAGAPLLHGEQQTLELLRKEIVHRRTSITFADGSTATVIVEEIRPTSLFLRIVKTSDASVHPRGLRDIKIASISKLIYTARENLGARVFRTAIASALSAGILAKCTWRSPSYAVVFEGSVSSRIPLVVMEFDVPGCES